MGKAEAKHFLVQLHLGRQDCRGQHATQRDRPEKAVGRHLGRGLLARRAQEKQGG